MDNKQVIFLVCTGLGRINRGYETFTQECFDTLKEEKDFQMHLYKGEGYTSHRVHALPHLHRDTVLAKLMAKFIGKDSYFIEQLTYFFFFVFSILKHRPKVIFYSDFILGTFLFRFKTLFGLKYQLLFSNGAPNGPPFSRCDYVQQLLPSIRNQALRAGEDPEKHFLVPYGLKIEEDYKSADKVERRRSLGLPTDKTILLSVGAINKHHKRMDYLVKEVARLDTSYYLVMLGQSGEETEEVRALANAQLANRFTIKTVLPEEVAYYYHAADVFVLCSKIEGFGRVYIEALKFGLPVLAHDYDVSRDVLGNFGYYADFTKENGLSELLASTCQTLLEEKLEDKLDRFNFVKKTYSWGHLKNQYISMLKSVLD